MNHYKIFADLVMLLHLIFVLSIVTGLIASFRVRNLRPLVFIAFVLLLAVWRLFGSCPLTTWQVQLLSKAGIAAPILAEKGFIGYYLLTWFHLNLSAASLSALFYILGGILLILNFEYFFTLWSNKKHQPS